LIRDEVSTIEKEWERLNSLISEAPES